jgi:predicted TIM-barrel fold metal-dependent hydrolase
VQDSYSADGCVAKIVQAASSPSGPVVPGGITDRLLSDFPNVYGDLSASSGFRAIARDRGQFLARHQNKLLFGSDCEHGGMEGPTCWGGRTLQLLRTLPPSVEVSHKILYGNAQRVLKLSETYAG